MNISLKKSLLLFTLTICQFTAFNSSFAKTSSFNLNDSLHYSISITSYSDNAPVGKISIPNKNMIRRADNEMHRNMKADLAEAKTIIKNLKGLNPADLNIHVDFLQHFLLAIPKNNDESDNKLSIQFSSENIKLKNINSIQIADFHINKSFYSSN